jgi:hypothetical protein
LLKIHKLPELLTNLKFLRLLAISGAPATRLAADWRDDIGHSRLQLRAGPELPLTVAQGLTQVEVLESGANYAPGSITITHSGDTTLPLYVPLAIAGSAVPGSHYQPLPTSVTLPAGQTQTTLAVIPIADQIAQGNRDVIVSIAADFASVRDPLENATITIKNKPFDPWRISHFTSDALNDPQISGAIADPDGDQLANLVEYAMGLDPNLPSISTAIIQVTGGYLNLTVTKNPGASDLTWAAEVSADLRPRNDSIRFGRVPPETGPEFTVYRALEEAS